MFSIYSPWKILYWRKRIEQLLKGEMPDPIVFTIDPSNLCNLSCPWCFTMEYNRKNPGILDAGLMHGLIDDLSKTGLRAVALCGGGEPLMNPETPAAIRHIADTGKRVGLITNGTLLNDDSIAAVLSCCDYIRISVDAADESTWCALHGGEPKHWQKLMESIRALRAGRSGERPTIGVSFLVCPDNHLQIPDAAALFKRLGADYIAYKMVYTDYPWLKGLPFSGKQFFSEKNVVLWELFRRAEDLADPEFRILYRHPGMFKKNEIGRPSHYYSKCRATPLGIHGISANGDMYCCCDRRGELLYGRYGKDGDFQTLWHSKRHYEVLDSIDLKQCPDRCCAQETNQIIEYGFVEQRLEWDWSA